MNENIGCVPFWPKIRSNLTQISLFFPKIGENETCPNPSKMIENTRNSLNMVRTPILLFLKVGIFDILSRKKYIYKKLRGGVILRLIHWKKTFWEKNVFFSKWDFTFSHFDNRNSNLRRIQSFSQNVPMIILVYFFLPCFIHASTDAFLSATVRLKASPVVPVTDNKSKIF